MDSGCDNTGATQARPNVATRFHRVVDGVAWDLKFQCGPGARDACQCGVLRNGDVWIARRNAAGVPTPVTVTDISASTGLVGAEFNPVGGQGGQGVCVRCEASYEERFDLERTLPFVVAGEGSIFAGSSIEKGPSSRCFDHKGHSGCLGTAVVFTFLDRVPEGAVPGATLWRPPFAGSSRAGRARPAPRIALYDGDLRPSDEVLPRIDWRAIHPKKRTPGPREWQKIADRWDQPFYQSCVAQRGANNCSFFNAYRNFIPASDWPEKRAYTATRADQFSTDLMDLEGPGLVADKPAKAAAVAAMVQQGFDVFGQARAGVAFDAGAGQGVGSLMPFLFFGAHLGTTPAAIAVRSELRSIDPHVFAELLQISLGSEGDPTWGDGFGQPDHGVASGTCGGPFSFWQGLLVGQCYRGATGVCAARGRGSGSVACGDPYGYIDGSSLEPGGSYYHCCSAPIILHTWWHALLIPGMRDVFATTRLENFFDNFLKRGRKIDGAWHATPRLRPDPCAPPPPPSACERPGDVTSCEGWRERFGPSLEDPNQCVGHGGNPDTEGRFGHRPVRDPGPPLYKMVPMNLFVQEGDATGLVAELRACRHPGQAHLRGEPACPDGTGPRSREVEGLGVRLMRFLRLRPADAGR